MLDLIQWRAKKTPEAKALFFNGRWYSFRDLEGRANRLANRLLALGIQKGDRIGIVAHNHVAHFDLLLAAPKIGFVFAPFNPHLDRATLLAQTAVVKPALVFADSRHHDTALAFGVPWTRLSDYREWLAVGSLDLPGDPGLTVDDTHLVYGGPRGLAALPYRQVLLNARHSADSWGLSASDSTVHCLPCYGPELHLLCLPLLYRGGRVVLMSGFDTDEYLGHLALHRVTVSALTPAMLQQLSEYGDFEDADLSSLHWFASVGAPASFGVRQLLARRGLALRTLHALAEAGPNLFDGQLEAATIDPALLGTPLPDIRASLLRRDGEPVAAGETGRLMVAGPMVFAGELAGPANRSAASNDEAYDTGLAACLDAEGRYRYRGRSEDAFFCGDGLVYPAEIEIALLTLDCIIDAAVCRLPDTEQGSAILASVVLQDGVERSHAALAAATAQLLPPALRPRHYQRRRQLPRDAWGCVQRQKLVEDWLARPAAD